MLQIKFNKGSYDAIVSLKDYENGEGFRRGMEIAMENSLLRVQGQASTFAPFQTGNLKRSITHTSETAGKTMTGHVGSNLVYARIQEQGGYAGRGHRVHITGRFYLKRAVEDSRAFIQEQFRKWLIIKKI